MTFGDGSRVAPRNWCPLKSGGTLHDQRTGEQPPRLGVTGSGGVAHVDHGVLDVGVPQPVADEDDVGAGVEEIDCDRVA